jgi:hypothetical protein
MGGCFWSIELAFFRCHIWTCGIPFPSSFSLLGENKLCIALDANFCSLLAFCFPYWCVHLYLFVTSVLWVGTCCAVLLRRHWWWPKVIIALVYMFIILRPRASCPCRFKASLLAVVIGRASTYDSPGDGNGNYPPCHCVLPARFLILISVIMEWWNLGSLSPYLKPLELILSC